MLLFSNTSWTFFSGSFDFVLMLAAYFAQVDNIEEGNDDNIFNATPSDEVSMEDFIGQLPSLIAGLLFVISGYLYYVVQSRAQTQRLIAMDDAARELNSPLV